MNDPRWKVHVMVRGHYSGCYEFSSEEAARQDLAERQVKFEALPIAYFLQAPGVDGPWWLDTAEAAEPGVFLR